MKFFTGVTLAALASMVSAAAVDVNKRASPLDVTLTPIGNSLVKASVTNNGATALNLLNRGTFLDSTPVQKLRISQGGAAVPFEGMLMSIKYNGLPADAFTEIAPGQTIEVEVNAAELHNLSKGGDYELVAQGAIPYAESGSTTLVGSAVPFRSNVLSMSIDGAQAAQARRILTKRTNVNANCQGQQLSVIQKAHSDCASLANGAAAAVGNKIQEYFKTTDSGIASDITARFRAIAGECSSTSSGATETSCEDTYNNCQGGVLAYTLPAQDYVVYCPLFFNELPPLTDQCHAQDQAGTVLHELAHAPGVYSPGTDDLGYGYEAATALSTEEALNNADSFALLANAVYARC